MNRLNDTFDKIGMLLLLVGLPLASIVAAGKPLVNYLEFPPLTRYVHHAGFSWPVFIGLAVAIVAVLIHFVVRVIKSQFSFSSAVTDDRSPVTDHCFASPPLPLASSPLPSIHYSPSTIHSPLPRWGWLGLAFTALAWVMAWTRFSWFSAFQGFTFTPLWIGYVVVVNALTYRRTGHCMLRDQPAHLLKLFLLSAAFWWYFEYLNRFVQNWCYEGIAGFSRLQYFIFATLPFSTVLPAVLGTYELLASMPRLYAGLGDFVSLAETQRTPGAQRSSIHDRGFNTDAGSAVKEVPGGGSAQLRPPGSLDKQDGALEGETAASRTQCETSAGSFVVGSPAAAWVALIVFSVGLALLGIWPDYLFPLLWVSPLFIIISWQALRGEETVLADISKGDWRTIWTAALSALICGFFWEMWNWHSFAKWVYTVPYVNRFHIFEMPILGYAGYLPFGLECVVIATMLGNKRRGGTTSLCSTQRSGRDGAPTPITGASTVCNGGTTSVSSDTMSPKYTGVSMG